MIISKLKVLCRHGRLSEALTLLHDIGDGDVAVRACASILEVCVASDAVSVAQSVHSHIVVRGFESSPLFHVLLFRAYQDVGDAEHAFRDAVSHRGFSWRSLFDACIREGKLGKALKLYVHMMEEGFVEPDEAVFLTIAKACLAHDDATLVERMHAYILSRRIPVRPHLGNMLLGYHLRCGQVSQAWETFYTISERDVVTWTTMVSGHTKQGKPEEALQLFEQMQKEGTEVDAMAMVAVLAACVCSGKLEKGRQLHACAISTGKSSNLFLANTLLDLYATWGSLEDAERVFSGMPDCDAVSWNILISGNAKKGGYDQAMLHFWRMCWDGIAWTSVTFLNVFDMVGEMEDLKLCRQFHVMMLSAEIGSTAFLQNALVHIYAKCGGGDGLADAQKMFGKIRRPDVAAWTAMISAHSDHGRKQDAWDCFWSMIGAGMRPNHITYVHALSSCSDMAQIRKVLDHLRASGIEPNVFVRNAAIAAYSKLGRLDVVQEEFEQMQERNVVSWTSVLSVYVKQRRPDMAVKLFAAMDLEGVEPNEVTYLCLLSACAALGSLEFSRGVHDYMVQYGAPLRSEAIIDAMTDVYLKCGSLEDSCSVMTGGDDGEGSDTGRHGGCV